MKMKKIFIMLLLIPSMALLWGCDDDDDNGNGSGNDQKTVLKEVSAGLPQWTIDMYGDEPTPNWQAPDPSLYENWMIFMVRMQEELTPYVSDDDMLALFINGELRAVNHPAKPADEHLQDNTEATFFILKVLGNEDASQEVEATLKYWSSRLHQTFTVKGKGRFIPEQVKGVDTEFLPDIMLGSSKYPVTAWLNMNFTPEEYGFKRSADDIMGVFIGDECRGINRIYRNGYTDEPRVVVFSKKEGEEARLLYYNATNDRVYETGKTFKTEAEDVTISLN